MTLTLEQDLKVQYAIPFWLRDEQIKVAIEKVSGRIARVDTPRQEPIAIVGYGPSLVDTWEQIKPFPYVISCSGAHRFLIDRGIVPTYHVEVDPRAHKITLLGAPHPDVEYLIASTCHPDYFDHLSGFNVKLWHVFDSTEEGRRTLPHGEWAITGGCDVGLRSMTLAAFLGFSDLHIFGIDGCARASSHAADHPNAKHKYQDCEVDGRTFQTTPALLVAAKQVNHELTQMPWVKATFYGDGLVQAMASKAREVQPIAGAKAPPEILGFAKPPLISAQYAQLNRRLHRDNLAYGVGGGRHAPVVLKLVEQFKSQSVLDYGCGKGYLAKAMPFPIWEYDPALPEKAASPRPADIVVCADVLEHVEPDHLLFVLDDLRRVTRKVAYFVIHTTAARKVLADGRNTHLIQHEGGWWLKRLGKFFHARELPGSKGEARFVAVPR